MKISVVGTGYVGLVVGTCFAESGNDEYCVDIDEEKIRRLIDGQIPIYEPGLEELVQRNVEDGRLRFTTNLEEAVQDTLIQFIAVGTPPDEDGSADLKNVLAVASGKGVVGKSTVAANLALALRAAGAEVGLLDADLYGPSMPTMFNVKDSLRASADDRMLPVRTRGIHLVSIGFAAGEGEPVIWRGPLVSNVLKQLLERYPSQLRLVSRQFPLNQRSWGAAEAAACANEQGRFWDFHRKLFASGGKVDAESLRQYASEAELDLEAFQTCVDERRFKTDIEADLAEGREAGVTGTPAFFVNGILMKGSRPLDDFVAIIEKELRRTGS